MMMNNTSDCLCSGLDRPKTIPKMAKLTTLANGGSLTFQRTVWQIAATSSAKSYCASMNSADTILFSVRLDGCAEAFQLQYNHTGQVGRDLICAIARALNMHPNICALGMFGEVGGNLEFTSIFPGLNIEISAEFDSTHFTITQLLNSPAASGGQFFEHGTVAHTSLNNLSANNVSGRPLALKPSQNPSLPGSTEQFAGIVIDCDGHERSPASPTYPLFSDCNSPCPNPEPCIRVLDCCCENVEIQIEGSFNPANAKQLYYRFAPSVDGAKVGVFRFGPGTVPGGLALFPKAFKVVGMGHKSNFVIIRMD